MKMKGWDESWVSVTVREREREGGGGEKRECLRVFSQINEGKVF